MDTLEARRDIGLEQSYIEQARELTPMLREAGDEMERRREVTPEIVEAMKERGIFRMLLPRSLGGAELDPPTFVRTIEAIAKADGSTAWCLCQNNVCSIVAAWLPADGAREIFGDPRAVLAWGPGPARADAVPGGYRVTGSWSFASGGRHATWLGAHCPVFEADGTQRLDAAGVPIELTVLFPARDAPMTDIWHVV